MTGFLYTEARSLYLHRVILDEVTRTPNLLARARAALPALRRDQPRLDNVWEEWEAVLALPLAELAALVLADTPRAGLLRAHSPFLAALLAEERNALWQRVGIQQFAHLFLEAAADLALDAEECSAIVAVPAEDLAAWHAEPPLMMTLGTLDKLKLVVAIQRALARLMPEQDMRRAWLRSPVDFFRARPLDLMMRGEGEELMERLTVAVQALLTPADMPSA